MQSDADFDRALASYEPRALGAPRQYAHHCPRCQRGISNPKLLQRPFWREDGPFVCSSCVSWEKSWMHIEEERTSAIEHARGRR